MINRGSSSTSRRLKIALVLNRFHPEVGGAEINLFFQASALARHHDVTVFTPRRLAETPVLEHLSGFTVRRLFDWRNPWRRFPNLRSATLMPGLFWHLFWGKFDLVQAFPSLNHNSMLAFGAARLRRRPFILCSFDWLDYAALEKKTGKIAPDCLLRHHPRWWRRLILRHCSHIFAISSREEEFFRRYNARVSYSPVPIQPAEYASQVALDVRRKYSLDADSMIFLVLGRMARIKGQDLAVRAFCRAAEKMPGAVLALVGRHDHDLQLLAEIKAQVAEHGLESRVLLPGMVAREEVIAFLQQSDIHVVPVRFMNSGAVVVESWAAGTPVLQSDAVDPNLVREKQNGFLFKSGNVEELAEKMVAAFAQRQILPSLGKAGQTMVLEKYTYDNLMDVYQKVYDNCLNNNKEEK